MESDRSLSHVFEKDASMRNRYLNNNLRPFRKMLARVRSIDFSDCRKRDFRTHMNLLRNRLSEGGPLSALIPETFALVAEAIRRTLHLSPYDAQLLAALSMNEGRVIEFLTGEGKTLVAVFVAALRALDGKGVHILTFNDYLAERDARWMGPVYSLLGLSVGFIRETSSPEERKAAYRCDITYVTAREAGFDYLRSFLVSDESELVHRPFHYAIIDEADSIMIDEARVPMVIAGEQTDKIPLRRDLFETIRDLTPGIHFETDEYSETIFLTEDGIREIEVRLGVPNLFETGEDLSESLLPAGSDSIDPMFSEKPSVDLFTQANVILPALFLLKKDVDYIVRDGEVRLVDEFTGRVSLFRRWPDGLQAAVELKEGINRHKGGIVLNSVTFRHFIRMYPDFCGMTGTACSAAPEFAQFYDKAVTVIPPNTACIRKDLPDYIYTHSDVKYRALIDEIRHVSETCRPILVGTASVEESERISALLREEKIAHEVLNARNDEREAEIIADAGKPGAITISTNMAGRGVDIRLGGHDESEREKVCALGGLYVIGTNRHESVRIDNQLRGRAGRQGDPGESRFFISLEDPMLVKYRIGEALSEKFRLVRSETRIDSRSVRSAIRHTQRVVEGQNFDTKTTLEKYSFMPNEQRKLVENKRMNILRGKDALRVLETGDSPLLQKLLSDISENEYRRIRKQVELYAINRCWADHWVAVQNALDGVEIVSMLRGDPFLTYNQHLIEAFEHFEEHLNRTVLSLFESLRIHDGAAELPDIGIARSGATFSYLVHDGSEESAFVSDFALAYLNAPFYLMLLLFHRFFNRSSDREE